MTMPLLSDEHQQATVREIAFSLEHRWLASAVITAGPNGKIARGHFVKLFKEADEKSKLRLSSKIRSKIPHNIDDSIALMAYF